MLQIIITIGEGVVIMVEMKILEHLILEEIQVQMLQQTIEDRPFVEQILHLM
jgi:hypothetical protein